MKVRLVQGSSNLCFELVDDVTGVSLEFIQSDWEYPHLARMFGWSPCECRATDGTVDCDHKTASEMISEAYDHLSNSDGEVIDTDDYEKREEHDASSRSRH